MKQHTQNETKQRILSPCRSLRFSVLLHLSGFLLALLCHNIASAQTRTETCRQLYALKAYRKAGKCFLYRAKAMGDVSQNQTARWNKGRLVLSAARLFHLSAKQLAGNRPTLAMQLKWRSYRAFHLYLSEKLYENADRKAKASQSHQALKRSLRLGTLTLQAPTSTTGICVKGPSPKTCHTASRWSIALLPGSYQITVSQPGHITKTRRISLRPFAHISLSFAPKQSRLRITSFPSDAMIVVDGIKRGRTPLSLTLRPGPHTLRISKRCYHPVERAIQTTTAPQDLRFPLRFHPSPPAPASAKQAGGWGLLLAGGALVIGGSILLALVPEQLALRDQAVNQYNDRNVTRTQAQFDQLFQQQVDASNTANTLFGIGIAGMAVGTLGAGIGIYLLASPTKRPIAPCRAP